MKTRRFIFGQTAEKAAQRESYFQEKVLRHLREFYGEPHGVWVKYAQGPFSQAGVSDIVGCYKGLFVSIECKAPGRYNDPRKGLTRKQERWLEKVQAAGGIALCVDNIEEIERALNSL